MAPALRALLPGGNLATEYRGAMWPQGRLEKLSMCGRAAHSLRRLPVDLVVAQQLQR